MQTQRRIRNPAEALQPRLSLPLRTLRNISNGACPWPGPPGAAACASASKCWSSCGCCLSRRSCSLKNPTMQSGRGADSTARQVRLKSWQTRGVLGNESLSYRSFPSGSVTRALAACRRLSKFKFRIPSSPSTAIQSYTKYLHTSLPSCLSCAHSPRATKIFFSKDKCQQMPQLSRQQFGLTATSSPSSNVFSWASLKSVARGRYKPSTARTCGAALRARPEGMALRERRRQLELRVYAAFVLRCVFR